MAEREKNMAWIQNTAIERKEMEKKRRRGRLTRR